MKYTVVSVEDAEIDAFLTEVKQMIEDGWAPLGGVSVVKVGTYGDKSQYEGDSILRYHQAMVKP